MSPTPADAASGPLVFLVAGEPSGDALGAKLMRALRAQTNGAIRFAGVGGERMAAEGLRSLFPLQDIAVMGITEIVPQIPRIFRRLRMVTAAIRSERPAAVVTIDAPAFCLRVARATRPLGIPVVHYVAPQLWAWRPRRVKNLIGRVDMLMLLFPFEAAFFERAGVRSAYVGHPVIEDAGGDGAQFRARHGIEADAPVLLALPGSRRGLVGRMLPVYAGALARLHAGIPRLRIVVPVVAGTADAVSAAAARWPFEPILVGDPREKRSAMAAATAAVTISGTATLELAVARVPMVVTYVANRASAWLARRLIKVPYVAMPNLVAGRKIVPELLQEGCTPEAIVREAERLLTRPEVRERQKEALGEVAAVLGQDGSSPSMRAAAVVLSTIREASSRRAPRAPGSP